jgi:hypothetical protein
VFCLIHDIPNASGQASKTLLYSLWQNLQKTKNFYEDTKAWNLIEEVIHRTYGEKNGDHQEQEKEVSNLSIIFFSRQEFVVGFQVDTSN